MLSKTNILMGIIMKKFLLLVIILITVRISSYANPIDDSPIVRFSELVFDSNNNWKMELLFSFPQNNTNIDSIVLKVSDTESKLKATYPDGTQIAIITADSLTVPLTIHRDGDKIDIYTYSFNYNGLIRKDSIIFGNYPGATVGSPVNGYSILRYTSRLASTNYLNIDILTKRASLGVLNDTTGESGILKGHIYDNNNKPIKGYLNPYAGKGIVILEAPIKFNQDGTYTTPIFNTFYNPGCLTIQIVDFIGFEDTLEIEPIELKNIHPDTAVVQDIHLKSDCPSCEIIDAINRYGDIPSDEIKLINYPNPFNLTTNFFVKIPDKLRGKPGNISIYNINGQIIRTIPINNNVDNLRWNGKDSNGTTMSSGIYYYRLIINNNVIKSGSMILLK